MSTKSFTFIIFHLVARKNRFIVSTTLFYFLYISYRHQHEQVHCEYYTLSFYISHTGTSMNRYVVSTTLLNFSIYHIQSPAWTDTLWVQHSFIFLISQTDSCMNRWYMWVQHYFSFFISHTDTSICRYILSATLFNFFKYHKQTAA
jgi:hypothetical protein